MAKLSKEEAAALKRLQAKAEAPDAPEAQRVLNISINLGDEKQIKRGLALGLLSEGDLGEEEEEGEEEEGEEGPKRRGYFKE